MKKMLFLIVSLFILISCTPKFKIGQCVDNGYCKGYVIDYYDSSFSEYKYKVAPFYCKDVSFNFAWVNERELNGCGK